MTIINFIIALAVFAVLLVVLGRFGKLTDLMGRLNQISKDEQYEKSSKTNAILFSLVGFIGLGLVVWSYISQQHKMLPEAASQLGRDWDKVFYNIFSPPIVLVFFLTHIALFYFVFKYRYNKDRKVTYFAHSNKLELIWTSVPLITMIIFGILTVPKWIQTTSAPSEDALRVKVTGMQFKWFMAYPGTDGEFGDRNIRKYGELANLLGLDPLDAKGYDDIYVDELVVPKGQEIAFELSALDVIHDFYLPHFRIKMDCVPGVPTRMKIVPDRTTEEMREITGNPEFNYEIACAELCGTGHWNMRRTIKVVEPAEYEQWIKEQTTAKTLYYETLLANLEKKKAEPKVVESHDNHEVEEHEDVHHETASL